MVSARFSLLVLAAALLPAQPNDVVRIGPGVTPPRLTYKIEPEYSPQARADHIQGTVILQIIVDERGRPTNITVVSPLGFGLDEQAISTVSKWEFKPGTKDGVPVKILAEVEVNFRFPGIWFDEKGEQQRSEYNRALRTLNQANPAPTALEASVKSILTLAKQKFAPAMYLIGTWKVSGQHVAKDPAEGLGYLQKAASARYGPALYEIAVRRIEGRDLPLDPEKGLHEMQDAATLGSANAQYYVGQRYETGDGLPRDIERARRAFRLCAAKGIAQCQYRLGRSLFDAPNRQERDYIQAVALFQLAADHGLAEAIQAASDENPKLSPDQTKWVESMKKMLAR